MSESLTTSSEKTGLPPGSLIHVGDVLESEARIKVIHYTRDTLIEEQIRNLDGIIGYQDRPGITWIIVEGLTNIGLVEAIGQRFDIHALVLEDILNTQQRPKFEEYEHYLYVVLKSLALDGDDFSVADEQISLLVLEHCVFTFKEKKDELLSPIINRLRNSKGRFRSFGTDYLTYAILDSIVDQNFVLIDSLDDAITAIEEDLYADPTQDTLTAIQKLRRELIGIRRYTAPIRELVADLLRTESNLIREMTRPYLRDVSDHALRVTESIESYREILAGLLDIYISNVSNRMNEVMKVLTVFASIFIPLTFLAGIYGMNFEYMPELKWKWAYPTLWTLFITIPVVLLIYFKNKKWL